ncbi:hypothetical protein [Kitasatospora sp. LaBMicrA B282]|uniref:hypothetical protein n=1 Tax=Kitasatospora sp. LaBMicrA B282 TaxID=3420949 RepID=UPI003D0AE836
MTENGSTPAVRPGGAAVEHLAGRCLGAALLVAAVEPAGWHPAAFGVALAVLGAGFGWWAAPPVELGTDLLPLRFHWLRRAYRHRSTVLAVAAVLLAAFSPQRAWSAVATTALLLGYLLWTEGRGEVPRPASRAAVAAAFAAAALVLLAAVAPTDRSDLARLLAALGVAATAGTVGLTLYERRAAAE